MAKDLTVISEETLIAEELPPTITATEEEVTILAALANGKSPKQATKAAGLDVANDIAGNYCSALQRRYNDRLQDELERRGLTVGKLVDVMVAQVDATKFHSVKGPAGEGTTLEEVPDNTARQGAVNMVMDILPGARAQKTLEVTKYGFEEIIIRLAAEEDGE